MLLGSTVLAGAPPAPRPVVTARLALVAVGVVFCLVIGSASFDNPSNAGRSVDLGTAARGYRQDGMLRLPTGARAPVSAALGQGSSAYRVTAVHGGYRAHSPEQGLAERFARVGVSVVSSRGVLGLAVRGIGYGRRLSRIGATAPTAVANRVSYALGGGLRDWYTNGPLGLEQGFSLAKAPAGGGGPLTLSLAVTGNLRARLTNGAVSLTGHGATLRYDGLVVRDARGRKLRAWLELRHQHVLIRIADRGAQYPLRIDPWIQSAKLTAGDATANAEFGYSVAVSGNTVVVGAPHANDGAGAVYVFHRSASGWTNATQTAELSVTNPETDGGAFAGEQLGFSVAIDGSTIVAGAPYWTKYSGGGNVEYQGAVYEWTLPNSGVWANATQTAYLTATNLTQTDYLGASVAVQGSTIVAGAPNHLGETPEGGPGSVYVYTMPASGGWVNATQTAQLGGYDPSPGNGLGYSVAISGATIVAGAPEEEFAGSGNYASRGGIYVFTEPAGGWVSTNATAELIPNDLNARDQLGISVAVSGSTIVGGAPFHNTANRAQGAAYVWTLPPVGGWNNATQPAELTSTDTTGPVVGESVAVSGSTIFSGGGPPNSNVEGAVYEWTRPASGFWADETQAAKLTAGDGAGGNRFGYAMAISGTTLVVGAIGANGYAGNAYVFNGGFTISGKVFGTSCSDTACVPPKGVPGYTVLVKGASGDSSVVAETGVSGQDGSWSVQVPAGSYTAGLSADGSSFASAAMEQAVNVTNAPVGGVNFTACAETVPGSMARHSTARDSSASAASEHAFAPSYCESEYTFKLKAKIPQKIIVDASKNAHYNTTSNNGPAGFNDSPSFVTAIRDFFRSSVGANEEFPDCMPPGRVALYTRENADVKWYSYINAGTAIASANVKFIWNQSTHKMELASPPSYSSVSLTRTFVYQVQISGRTIHGSCPDKAKLPILLAAQPAGNNNEGVETAPEGGEDPNSAPFGFEVGVWFPFDPYGTTIDSDTTLGEKLIDAGAAGAKFLFKGATALSERYERLPAYGKFLIETGVNLTIGLAEEKVGIAALGKAAEWYEQYSTGTRLTAEELEKLELIGTVKGASELLYTVPLEAYRMYAGYFGYPIMSAVIRGRIATAKYLPSAEVSPPRAMPYETSLGVTVSTTKFPTWSLQVSRDALDTCLSGCKVWEGALPWKSNPVAEPETFNPFSIHNSAYVVENSAKTGHSYKSGYQAVQNIIADTSQNPELAFGIRHKGSITANFAAAEDETPAPSCDAVTGRSSSPETICWIFSDWRP